jgi:hypothetical protein
MAVNSRAKRGFSLSKGNHYRKTVCLDLYSNVRENETAVEHNGTTIWASGLVPMIDPTSPFYAAAVESTRL